MSVAVQNVDEQGEIGLVGHKSYNIYGAQLPSHLYPVYIVSAGRACFVENIFLGGP